MTTGHRGPIVVLTTPGGGDGALVRALSRAAGVTVPRDGTPPFPEALPTLRPGPERQTHRLTAIDARGRRLPATARRALEGSLEGDGRPLLTGLRLALRIPFLAAVLPEVRFVLVHRELRTALALALDGWRSGQVVSAPDLPGWDGPPWSLPLVPSWPALAGLPLGEIVGRQWSEIATTALDDLDALEPERWRVVDREALLADPQQELERLCGFLALPYDQSLLSPIEAARRSTALRPPPIASPELDAALAAAAEPERRLRALLGERPAARGRVRSAPNAASPMVLLGSRSSGSLAPILRELGASLLVSSPQAGILACVRERDGRLNTHFRRHDQPTAVAATGGRLALATRTELWEFRDVPAAVAEGREDAHYVPRRRHLMGPAAIEDLGFVDDELWLASAELSCLATLDDEHSLVPRWRPPFVSAVAPGDRCHLSGFAVRDGQVSTVTALGVADTPGGWRAGVADGGVLVDVASGEIIASGLSLPCSPRWHDGRLWLLEGGQGRLGVVDSASGRVEPVVALPGFVRGMQIAGPYAFVGLSQLRAPGEAAGLPLTQRLAERRSGVWVVDLRRGTIAGFLRFEDVVQEISGVALVSRRWPEIAEPGGGAAADVFALPAAARSTP